MGNSEAPEPLCDSWLNTVTMDELVDSVNSVWKWMTLIVLRVDRNGELATNHPGVTYSRVNTRSQADLWDICCMHLDGSTSE